MTIKEAPDHIKKELQGIYENSEASAIADLLIENLTGVLRAERVNLKEEKLNISQQELLGKWLERLKQHEPVQYILNECWFYGLKFYVDNNVLIPRPETEELVDWIVTNQKFPFEKLNFLDIGTGSGCIAISLKRRFRKAEAWACDASEKALQVARKNSELLGAEVRWLKLDFLDNSGWDQLPGFDLVISNPPYVPEKERLEMAPNVVKHEPAAALFVPDEDPTLFYRKIAEFGRSHLNPGGLIYVEIHEGLGDLVLDVFASAGYTTELRKDMQGKERMVKAFRV